MDVPWEMNGICIPKSPSAFANHSPEYYIFQTVHVSKHLHLGNVYQILAGI